MNFPNETHFKITELPQSNIITSTINGGSIVLNQLYPIEDQSLLSFKKTEVFNDLSINTHFKWMAYDSDNDIYSSVALGDLKWYSTTVTPSSTSSDGCELINNSESFNLLSKIFINSAVEFIEILEVTGFNNLKLNNNAVFVGQRLTVIDLFNCIFTAADTGGGDPYLSLSYKVGRDNVTRSTIYNLCFKIDARAELQEVSRNIVFGTFDEFDRNGQPIVYDTIEETTVFKITKGSLHGTAKMTFNVLSDIFSAVDFYEVPYSSITFSYSGREIVKREAGQFIDDIILDSNGEATLIIKTSIVTEPYISYRGDITITLDEINNDPLLVEGVQSKTIITEP